MNRNRIGRNRLRAVLLGGLIAMVGLFAAPSTAQAGATGTDAGGDWRPVLTLEIADPRMTIGEVARLAGDAAGTRLPAVDPAAGIASDRAVSAADAQRLLAGGHVPGMRLLEVVENPRGDTTLDTLTADIPTSPGVVIGVIVFCSPDVCVIVVVVVIW